MPQKILIYKNSYNSVKREEPQNFSESLFENEYIRASKIVEDIIRENIPFFSETGDSENYPEIYNVISFLGGRGTGKTSAMTSYGDFLGKYTSVVNKNNAGAADYEKIENFLFKIGNSGCYQSIRFHRLDMINAAMLSRNENLLDIIWAQMWDCFNQEIEYPRTQNTMTASEQMADKFQKLKRDYDYYLTKPKDSGISDISKLHNLSASLNLRKSFYELVKAYLQYFNSTKEKYSFLVISIDDIDMAGKNCFSILEQISLFLNIPRVIVMVTADMLRLNQICAHYYFETYAGNEQLIKDGHITASIIKGKNTFARDYLEKVIAVDMRINMPDFKSMPINYDEDHPEKGVDLKRKLLLKLHGYGIEFDKGTRPHHFLEENTLRSNIAMLHEFDRMTEEKENREMEKKFLIGWLRQKLRNQLIPRINSEEDQEQLLKIFSMDKSVCTEALAALLFKMIKREAPDFNYGVKARDCKISDVLFLCKTLEESSFEYGVFANAIITHYTLLFMEMEGNSEKPGEKEFPYDGTVFERNRKFAFESSRMIYNRKEILNKTVFRLPIEVEREVLSQIVMGRKNEFRKNFILLIKHNQEKILMYQVLLLFFKDASNVEADDDFVDSGYDINTSDTKSLQETEKGNHSGAIDSYNIYIKIGGLDGFSLDYSYADLDKIMEMLKKFKERFLQCLFDEIYRILEGDDFRELLEGNFYLQSSNRDEILKELKRDEKQELSKNVFLFDRFKEYEPINSIETDAVFPIRNIELRYNLIKEFENRKFDIEAERLYEGIALGYKLISDYLEEYDEYFGIENGYSKCFCKYPLYDFFVNKEAEENVWLRKSKDILDDNKDSKELNIKKPINDTEAGPEKTEKA